MATRKQKQSWLDSIDENILSRENAKRFMRGTNLNAAKKYYESLSADYARNNTSYDDFLRELVPNYDDLPDDWKQRFANNPYFTQWRDYRSSSWNSSLNGANESNKINGLYSQAVDWVNGIYKDYHTWKNDLPSTQVAQGRDAGLSSAGVSAIAQPSDMPDSDDVVGDFGPTDEGFTPTAALNAIGTIASFCSGAIGSVGGVINIGRSIIEKNNLKKDSDFKTFNNLSAAFDAAKKMADFYDSASLFDSDNNYLEPAFVSSQSPLVRDAFRSIVSSPRKFADDTGVGREVSENINESSRNKSEYNKRVLTDPFEETNLDEVNGLDNPSMDKFFKDFRGVVVDMLRVQADYDRSIANLGIKRNELDISLLSDPSYAENYKLSEVTKKAFEVANNKYMTDVKNIQRVYAMGLLNDAVKGSYIARHLIMSQGYISLLSNMGISDNAKLFGHVSGMLSGAGNAFVDDLTNTVQGWVNPQ